MWDWLVFGFSFNVRLALLSGSRAVAFSPWLVFSDQKVFFVSLLLVNHCAYIYTLLKLFFNASFPFSSYIHELYRLAAICESIGDI